MVSNHSKKIVEYLIKNLKKGYTLESLKWALVRQGYPRSIIDKAIIEAHNSLSQKAPLLKEKPIIKYELYDADDNPIIVNDNLPKISLWKRLFGRKKK